MEFRVTYLRIVQAVMLVSLCLYVWLGEWLRKEPKTLSDLVILKAMALFSIVNGAIVLFVRMQLLPATEEKLRLEATDSAVLTRWSMLNIMSFALCESIGLFGLVLRILGASLSQAAGFYAAAVILLLLSTPRRP